ncbi:MAG: hypothetical protein Kow0068_06430 [Marinilabiliales bacterium]
MKEALKIKTSFIIFLLFFSSGLYAQFAENEYDFGVSLNFRYDFFNSFDNFPAIEFRYNRNLFTTGLCVGHNRNELTKKDEINNIDGIYISWNYRIFKEKKKFDTYLGLFFNNEKYYYTYLDDKNHQKIYDETGYSSGIVLYETWNLKNGFYVIFGLETGYSYSSRELNDATIILSKTEYEYDPVIAFHIGFKYNFIRLPYKKENNKTF